MCVLRLPNSGTLRILVGSFDSLLRKHIELVAGTPGLAAGEKKGKVSHRHSLVVGREARRSNLKYLGFAGRLAEVLYFLASIGGSRR